MASHTEILTVPGIVAGGHSAAVLIYIISNVACPLHAWCSEGLSPMPSAFDIASVLIMSAAFAFIGWAMVVLASHMGK
jgi:hypothetical protein